MSRPREYPHPWVNPNQYIRTQPVVLLKLEDSSETQYRCMACGERMTASELKERRTRQRARVAPDRNAKLSILP